MHLRSQVVLFILGASLIFFSKRTETAKRGCEKLLRNLQKNPPSNNTVIAINIRLSKARYRCRDGFKLVGQKIRSCKNGKWKEKQEPRCLGPCGRPANIPHAKFEGRNFDYKDKLRYSCKKGFKLRGPKKRTCREDGNWSRPPSCTQIKCTNPGNITIRNGSMIKSDPQYRYGTELVFECDNGFELRGRDTIICKEFGWDSRRLPYCKERECPDPGRPDNGDRFGDFKVGSTVRFSCQYGFVLHGSRERTCMGNLEWSGYLTTCQDGNTDCLILGTPIRGRKYGSEYNHGDIVRFECDRGFAVKGSPVRRCMENGTWNGTETTCKDELQDLIKDVNETSSFLRKNMLDPLLESSCNDGNETGCNESNVQDMDTRGRAIDLDSNFVSKGGLDLVFVLDSSSSVTRKGFEKGLNFSIALVDEIYKRQRKEWARIAFITFGTVAKLEFNWGQAMVDTPEKTTEAIRKVKYMGGATASAIALHKVRKDVVPFARDDSKRVLVFITDGKSNIGGPPEDEADFLKSKERFEIFAVGVGEKVRKRQLYAIASDEKKNVIAVKDYGTLQDAMREAVGPACGESQVELRARIVGGSNSKKGWWPWQVGIHKLDNSAKFQLICGGALISTQWVLTAAHCFANSDETQKYKIIAGDHDLDTKEKSEQEAYLAKIFVHQEFQRRLFLNDIALVKLKNNLEIRKYVKTVCLPDEKEGDLAIPSKYGYVSGWGATQALKPQERPSKAAQKSKVLKYSSYTIQHNRLCANRSSLPLNSTVSFCAGDGKGGNDTCRGDSGGAFVREGKRGQTYRWVVAGLVSWGEGCAQKDQYGYYTRVHPFIDWIRKTVSENTDLKKGNA